MEKRRAVEIGGCVCFKLKIVHAGNDDRADPVPACKQNVWILIRGICIGLVQCRCVEDRERKNLRPAGDIIALNGPYPPEIFLVEKQIFHPDAGELGQVKNIRCIEGIGYVKLEFVLYYTARTCNSSPVEDNVRHLSAGTI